MKPFSNLLILLIVSMLQACFSDDDSEQNPETSEISEINTVSLSGNNREASAQAFRETVHPITLANCSQCHSSSGTTLRLAPYHADSDYLVAHDVVVDTARVNFSDIPSSRLVLRLREDNHYCWSSNCDADANEMQAAIERWSSQFDTSGVATINGVKTEMIPGSSAEIRIPETINNTIVMQAESGTLSGRFITKSDSKASEFTYVGTEPTPSHPIEGTARTASIHFEQQDCSPPSSGYLQETQNGPFRIREPARHIDQTGYRYYSMQVIVGLIRPHLRQEFRDALRRGDRGTQLQRFLITPRGPEDEDSVDGPLEGNTIARNIVRVLPEFEDKTFFDTRLHGPSAELNRDFFAPRFGPTQSEFWAATDPQIRANLADTLKRGRVYDQVIDAYRRWFYDFSNQDRSWVAQNRRRDVPFTLRRLPDGTPFEANNLVSSDTFYDHYLGGLTRENAFDIIDGMPRIDSYVYYFIDPDSRNFNDFNQDHREADGTTRRDRFDMDRGDVTLDLANFYTDGNVNNARSIRVNNYNDIIKPIFAQNCIQCHGNNSNLPQFAVNDKDQAFDAAASIRDFFDVADPTNARPVQRMLIDRHNCFNNQTCDQLGAELIQAITEWNNKNITDEQTAQNENGTGLLALSEQARTPGRARFNLNIANPGLYSIWLKMRTNENDNNGFYVRLLDSNGEPLISEDQNNQNPGGCESMQNNTNSDWDWYTDGVNNPSKRTQWSLGQGEYTLEVVEQGIGAAIDLIAVSQNPEFNPAKNLVDESNIQSNNPRILVYDLENIIGQPGQFEIEIRQNASGDAYLFRNPRFRGINANVRFSNIKLLVNDQYEFSNATYTKLNRVVNGMDSGILTASTMVALVNTSLSSDLFSFVFKDLTLTEQAAEPLDEDAPVPVNGRACLNLDLFQNTVMPVLNNFKLMLKDDYVDYSTGNFPGANSESISNPTVYNCTTCHTEEHPYFKMTTFAEGLSAGDPIPQDGLEGLCEQALSRVDFGNFERSLLLRGLNGTFNHPKLHFIQKATFTDEGNSGAFIKNNSDPSGYQSDYIGLRFEQWSRQELDLGRYNGDEKAFLERYVGRYKQIDYERYNNDLSLNDGFIMTENDLVINEGTDIEDLEQRNGPNRYFLINPMVALDNFSRLSQNQRTEVLNTDPITEEFPWKIKNNCIGMDFNTDDGMISDPCNNNVNAVSEFESVKQGYRESIINWMKEEKSAYDLLNSN